MSDPASTSYGSGTGFSSGCPDRQCAARRRTRVFFRRGGAARRDAPARSAGPMSLMKPAHCVTRAGFTRRRARSEYAYRSLFGLPVRRSCRVFAIACVCARCERDTFAWAAGNLRRSGPAFGCSHQPLRAPARAPPLTARQCDGRRFAAAGRDAVRSPTGACATAACAARCRRRHLCRVRPKCRCAQTTQTRGAQYATTQCTRIA